MEKTRQSYDWMVQSANARVASLSQELLVRSTMLGNAALPDASQSAGVRVLRLKGAAGEDAEDKSALVAALQVLWHVTRRRSASSWCACFARSSIRRHAAPSSSRGDLSLRHSK